MPQLDSTSESKVTEEHSQHLGCGLELSLTRCLYSQSNPASAVLASSACLPYCLGYRILLSNCVCLCLCVLLFYVCVCLRACVYVCMCVCDRCVIVCHYSVIVRVCLSLCECVSLSNSISLSVVVSLSVAVCLSMYLVSECV